jgi:hypothetical protein
MSLYQAKNRPTLLRMSLVLLVRKKWLRGQDLTLRPSGYEPDELPGCSTPRQYTGPKAEISGNLGLHR